MGPADLKTTQLRASTVESILHCNGDFNQLGLLTRIRRSPGQTYLTTPVLLGSAEMAKTFGNYHIIAESMSIRVTIRIHFSAAY